MKLVNTSAVWLIVCPHVKDLKITTSNFLPNEVIIKFDIFRSGMEDRVNSPTPGVKDDTDIVTV